MVKPRSSGVAWDAWKHVRQIANVLTVVFRVRYESCE
jgi:hypothetical protein